MSNKATIEIDCEQGTLSVFVDPGQLDLEKPLSARKAELIASIMVMKSKNLMNMSVEALADIHLDLVIKNLNESKA